MDLNYLRAFYEVAKAGKFSEAAKRINISQSALSRSVALLEAREGILLFDRSKKGVALTPKGHQIFLRCETLFHAEKAIEDLCRGVQEKCEGPLRFAASDHVINDYLVGPIHEFRVKFPKVIPSIFSGTPDEITDSLLNTDNEFGLLFAKINTPQVEFRKLRLEKMALVCNPELWRKHKAGSNEKTLKKVLENHGYLCSIGALLTTRQTKVLTELFGEMPQIGLETNSQEAQKRFCLAGDGVAYLARFMIKKEIENGELFEIPVSHPHEFDLWLARRKGQHLSLPARTFLRSFNVDV
ncbi:MAG: LysR family transcriptional regulator [Bdellovibrionota bacterium]